MAGFCNRVSDRLFDRSSLFLSQGSRHGTGSSPSPGCCWYNGKCDIFSNPIDLLAPIETKMKGGVREQVYIGSFSAGMGAMPWVVMSEVINFIPEGLCIINYFLLDRISLTTNSNIADISHKHKRSSRRHGDAGELVWSVGRFLHFQLPHVLELIRLKQLILQELSCPRSCPCHIILIINENNLILHAGTFIIYAAINALAIVFVIAIVPETKGKTLEQIQAVVNP